MQKLAYKTCTESAARQAAARRFNPATVATFRVGRRAHKIILPCGDSDECALFLDRRTVYVVSRNERYGYVGVEAYDLDTALPDDITPAYLAPEQTGEIFLQDTDDAREIVGPRWERVTLRTIARRLADHLN